LFRSSSCYSTAQINYQSRRGKRLTHSHAASIHLQALVPPPNDNQVLLIHHATTVCLRGLSHPHQLAARKPPRIGQPGRRTVVWGIAHPWRVESGEWRVEVDPSTELGVGLNQPDSRTAASHLSVPGPVLGIFRIFSSSRFSPNFAKLSEGVDAVVFGGLIFTIYQYPKIPIVPQISPNPNINPRLHSRLSASKAQSH